MLTEASTGRTSVLDLYEQCGQSQIIRINVGMGLAPSVDRLTCDLPGEPRALLTSLFTTRIEEHE